MHILLVNGPNLNILGSRDADHYGTITLEEIEKTFTKRASDLNVDLVSVFQANSEGDLVDFIQNNKADAIVINPGALTHYGYSLRDALEDFGKPVVEVHISNIYAREDFRNKSVIADIATGQISGLGLNGYLAALDFLIGNNQP
ncbi:MAG: type II 3-dehydroquinate dehydratase [Chloroflexota bacterium]|nr:type II 3-dehydroquinate dehydratase [Chloroflexota bacterium]